MIEPIGSALAGSTTAKRLERCLPQCGHCLMDSSAEDFVEIHGVGCNYCFEYLSGRDVSRPLDDSNAALKLDSLVAKLKQRGKRKPYDCVIGLSGGVDSSWVLVMAVELGLRPLAVHMDNGWNSEIAQNNISKLVRSLKVDLVTHVLNWPEYRSMMQAFFDADVVDVELLYDHAMLAVNYRQAKEFGVATILGGTNFATEGFRMPPNWNWMKLDSRNILSIVEQKGGFRPEFFPIMPLAEYVRSRVIDGITWQSFLDLMPYNKVKVVEELQTNFGFKPYSYKHYESVFTRFYQGFILPNKFNIDKRKLHLSALLMSGLVTREEAILDLNSSPYPSRIELEQDIQFFLSKMRWTQADLDNYISRPAVAHTKYKNSQKLKKLTSGIRKFFPSQ